MAGLGTGAVLMGGSVGVRVGGRGVGTALAGWVGEGLGGMGVGTAVVGWAGVELGVGIGVASVICVGVPLGESVEEGEAVAGAVGSEVGGAQPARIKVAMALAAISHRIENLSIIYLPTPCTAVDRSAFSRLRSSHAMQSAYATPRPISQL